MLTVPGLSLLTVSTVRLDDPGPLLDLLPDSSALAWVQGGEGLVGWGEAARLEVSGPDRFTQAQAWWDDLVSAAEVRDDVRLPGTGLVAFGSFAFDPRTGTSVLVVPQVVAGHRDGVWWVTTTGGDTVTPRPQPRPVPPSSVVFADGAVTGAEWMAAVETAVARITAGEVDKVVLARALEARAAAPVDLRWPLRRLAEDYPGCWAFAVDGLLGATPEVLLRLRDGVATSRVLAGTLRRTGDANEDSRRGAALGRSIKDVEEHGYGVRSVVDSLAGHCTDVEVPTAPFVLELRNVMHLATDVRGTVTDASTSLQLLASLHPSAAVCGTPTDVALDLIREIEGLDRGRYAGPVGWIDASGDGEWGIALRCAEVDPADPRRLRLFAGCGIVAGSQPLHELAESNAKLVPMRDALQD
ncbi:MAG: isochorismate synthase [Frankiales bacterium]|nr:MAG: isochorismate synthase [Frankiales bacterium]